MTTSRPPLPFPNLETTFERIAQAIDEVGDQAEALFLAKLALALSHKLGDLAEIEDAIAIAKRDLTGPHPNPLPQAEEGGER